MSLKNSVEFKGTKEGIVLQLDSELEFPEILTKLEEKLEKSGGFFKGANIIGIDGRTATRLEKTQLEALLIEFGQMQVKSLSPFVKMPIQTLAKNTLKPEDISDTKDTSETVKEAATEENAVFNGLKEGPTQFHRGTMRSGRSIVYHGNVVILGDVNPGAEIIANGNIVVMGHLRGVAHAGASGNHSAYVCANQLNPTQLRIGKLITRPPEENTGSVPEIAFIKDDMIVIEPYLI